MSGAFLHFRRKRRPLEHRQRVIQGRNIITYTTPTSVLSMFLPEEFILILDKLLGAVQLLLSGLDLLFQLNIFLVKSQQPGLDLLWQILPSKASLEIHEFSFSLQHPLTLAESFGLHGNFLKQKSIDLFKLHFVLVREVADLLLQPLNFFLQFSLVFIDRFAKRVEDI